MAQAAKKTSPAGSKARVDDAPAAVASTGTDVTASGRDSGTGVTSIDDGVVAKIASIAAREVDGVSELGGALSGAIAGVVGRIRGDEHRTSGVGVEVGTKQAAVDLSMTVHYPVEIHQVADAVRANVIARIEELTGLEVVEVNIAITDLAFPGGEDEAGADRRVE